MEPKPPPLPPPRDRRRARSAGQLVAVAAIAALLAGCQTPPPAAPPPPVPAPPPAVVDPPPPPAAPPPAGPAAQQQAQKAALAAVDLLEAGNDEAGRAEIRRALGLDAQNRLALNLNRQLDADPVATLGRESFGYTVRPGETLSKIAGRFLNDLYAFVLLARYNGIAVPKQVGVGQVLKIPGKPRPGVVAPAAPPLVARAEPVAVAPPPAAVLPVAAPRPVVAPPPAEATPAEKAMRSAQAAERAGDLATARLDYLGAADLGQAGAAAKAQQLGRTLVQRYAAAARGALARQELDTSIAQWQRVLDIEPDNATARSEIERMRGLKQKLGSLK